MAVPKKGRLYDQCIRLLERAGIKVTEVTSPPSCYHVFRGFINVFSRKVVGFHKQAKLSELNFFIRKTFL